VVDDLAANVYRRAVQLDRELHDFDGPLDAGTEAARLGQNNLHLSFSHCGYDLGMGLMEPGPQLSIITDDLSAAGQNCSHFGAVHLGGPARFSSRLAKSSQRQHERQNAKQADRIRAGWDSQHELHCAIEMTEGVANEPRAVAGSDGKPRGRIDAI